MSIKTQRKIMFIPIVNLTTLIFWLKMYHDNNIKHSNFIKSLLVMFAVCILVSIPRMLIHFIIGNDVIDNILFYISIWFYTTGIAFVSVVDQEKKTGDGS